jgi:hypothetical protein
MFFMSLMWHFILAHNYLLFMHLKYPIDGVFEIRFRVDRVTIDI